MGRKGEGVDGRRAKSARAALAVLQRCGAVGLLAGSTGAGRQPWMGPIASMDVCMPGALGTGALHGTAGHDDHGQVG